MQMQHQHQAQLMQMERQHQATMQALQHQAYLQQMGGEWKNQADRNAIVDEIVPQMVDAYHRSPALYAQRTADSSATPQFISHLASRLYHHGRDDIAEATLQAAHRGYSGRARRMKYGNRPQSTRQR